MDGAVGLSEEVEQARLPDPQQIVDQALAEAAEMIAAERARACEEGRTDGWKEGHREGHQEGRQEGQQEGHREGVEAAERETAEALQRLQGLIDRAEIEYTQALRAGGAEMVELSMAIGERIARRSLLEDREAVAAVVQEAVERAARGARIVVRINPQDEEVLEPHWDSIVRSRSGASEVVRALDESVERGGCVVEAGGGSVDATLATRIASARSALSLGAPPDSPDATKD